MVRPPCLCKIASCFVLVPGDIIPEYKIYDDDDDDDRIDIHTLHADELPQHT